jgi:hypothetical protein
MKALISSACCVLIALTVIAGCPSATASGAGKAASASASASRSQFWRVADPLAL